jgi:hypothetical protein
MLVDNLGGSSMFLAEIIPQLPQKIPDVNEGWQWFFTLAQVPPLCLMILLALRWGREMRTVIPLLFLLGGLLAMFNEPIVDHNGLVWFPTEGQWTLYETFGIPQPIWLALAYVWFFGGQPLVVWRFLEKGAAPRTLWKMFATIVVVDIILEHPGLYANLFLYYGDQPFTFTRFPLWWGVVNSTTPIVAATLVHLLRPYFSGKKVIGVALLFPVVQAATNAGTAWPVWNMLNTEQPRAVVWGAGVVSCGLCVFVVSLCVHALERHRGTAVVPETQRPPVEEKQAQLAR